MTKDPLEKRERFEVLALPLLPAVHRHALKLTGDVERARDLVQETCLRAYRTFENFRTGTNGKAWLLTILHSIFVNQYRKQRREPRAMSLEEVDERFQRLLQTPDGVSRAKENPAWSDADVEAALAELPASFRATVLLVDVEGLTYEEAAAALRSPIGTVRSRLNRARRLLYCALQDHARRAGYLRKAE